MLCFLFLAAAYESKHFDDVLIPKYDMLKLILRNDFEVSLHDDPRRFITFLQKNIEQPLACESLFLAIDSQHSPTPFAVLTPAFAATNDTITVFSR